MAYDAWGVRLLRDGKQALTLVPLREGFTGKEREAAVGGTLAGLDYFGARMYAPLWGRFTSVDPLLEKHPDVSPYAYVLDNPLALVDPDGRQVRANGSGFLSNSPGATNATNGALLTITTLRAINGDREAQAALAFYGARLLGGAAALAAGPSVAAWAMANPVTATVAAKEGTDFVVGLTTGAPDPEGVGGGTLGQAARSSTSFADDALRPSQGMIDAFRRQLSEHGERSLQRSYRRIAEHLSEHRTKLEQIRREGGHASSVETEIRTFERQLRAIDEILGGGQ